jgi:hypothetical protein
MKIETRHWVPLTCVEEAVDAPELEFQMKIIAHTTTGVRAPRRENEKAARWRSFLPS